MFEIIVLTNILCFDEPHPENCCYCVRNTRGS